MSWSISFIGTPMNVAEALKQQSEKLSGDSKKEFDAALPHMVGLLEQNWNTDVIPVLRVTANGHGWSSTTENKSSRSLNFNLEFLNATLV